MADLDPKALAPQRWDNLRALIRDSGVIRIEDLCRRLKVSAATVRRDLDQLEQGGAIRRVHGGAVSVESRLDEPVFADKTSLAAREKRRVTLKGDPAVPSAGCLVETVRGSIDAGLEAQIDEIYRRLFEEKNARRGEYGAD